jgi:hypothetical protein
MFGCANENGCSHKIAAIAIFLFYKKNEINSQKMSFTWYHISIE